METTQVATAPDEDATIEKPHSYRILVVDDDKNCAQTTTWILEILGHTVQMALDGRSAIELARSFHPDVVLCDIGMPGMNGYVICKALRKEPVLQNTLFIAQTGWGQKEHRERSKEAGFDYHLVKPVDMEALKNILLVLSKKVAELAV